MGRHLNPRYGQVILVSGYPDLTAVNWPQHGCAATTLARKCDISLWFPCGADEGPGRADVNSRVNQNFSDRSEQTNFLTYLGAPQQILWSDIKHSQQNFDSLRVGSLVWVWEKFWRQNVSSHDDGSTAKILRDFFYWYHARSSGPEEACSRTWLRWTWRSPGT